MSLDASLIATARERLYSAVVSDVLDTLGHPQHTMAPGLRPLDEGLTLFGRARTGLYMEMHYVEAGTNPYELEIELVDSLQADEIAVLACPPSTRIAPWGELLSTAARARGAAGCVTDGLVRDVRMIRAMRFPVFATGMSPLDARGRAMIMRTDVVVECAGARVQPGDYLLGDVDGLVVIPATLAEQTIELALRKVEGENQVRDELQAGTPLAEVFARHGIL